MNLRVILTACTLGAALVGIASQGHCHSILALQDKEINAYGIHIRASAQIDSPSDGGSVAANNDVTYASNYNDHYVRVRNHGEEPEIGVEYTWEVSLRHNSEETPRARLGQEGAFVELDPGECALHGGLSKTFTVTTTGSHTANAEAYIESESQVALVSHAHSWTQN